MRDPVWSHFPYNFSFEMMTRMHAGVSCLSWADNCHVKRSRRCIKQRQSASGTRSLRAGQVPGWRAGNRMLMARWSREMALRSPCSLPPCSCASLIDKSGRAGESVGTRGPLVPSSQVELWSPIYLGPGHVSVRRHCDLYQCPPTQILHSTPCRLGPQNARDVTASFVCQVEPLFWHFRSTFRCPAAAIHDATDGCPLYVAQALHPTCDESHANGKKPRPIIPPPSAAADFQASMTVVGRDANRSRWSSPPCCTPAPRGRATSAR